MLVLLMLVLFVGGVDHIGITKMVLLMTALVVIENGIRIVCVYAAHAELRR